jgi:hypothetical protein
MSISFAIATISLILNVSIKNDKYPMRMIPFTPFNLKFENTTVSRSTLKFLTDCVSYVEINVPVIPYFNTTIDIPYISFPDYYTGILNIFKFGKTNVNGILQLNYTVNDLNVGNSTLRYVNIADPMIYTVQNNNTFTFTFDSIYPLDVYGGVEGIYDLKQSKIESAPGPTIRLDRLQFIGTGFVLSLANLTAGMVVGITRAIQI